MNNMRPLLIRLLWITSIIGILTGFTHLSWGVSREYFEYRTTSHIAIRDYADVIKAPAIVVCFRYKYTDQGMNMTIGERFSGEANYFNDKNDTWRVFSVRVRTTLDKKEVYKEYETKKYLMGHRYCLFFQQLRQSNKTIVTSPENLALSNLYDVYITVTPAHSANTWGDPKNCTPKFVYFGLVTDNSTLSNPSNREVFKELCTTGLRRYFIDFTYSSFINIKLPPPYDTNCLDYRKGTSFLSTYDCYNECLQEKTKPLNVIPSTTLIDRKKYNNSTEYIAYEFMLENKTRVMKKSLPKELIQAYRTLSSGWDRIKKSCLQFCSRPDCWSEDISPTIISTRSWTKNFSKDNETLSKIALNMLLSHQPMMEVSTLPKYHFIDYVVYMSSMLSFWLGFCPLSLVDTIIRRLRECTRKTRNWKSPVLLKEKVLRQERGIKSLVAIIRSQEKRIRTLENKGSSGAIVITRNHREGYTLPYPTPTPS